MLEVSRVVDPGRQHDDLRTLRPPRRQRTQRAHELIRVVIDRLDPGVLEQFREDALHDLAVLEHVRDAGRHAQVVFEDVDTAVDVAHQIGAADMRPDAVRRTHAHTLGAEILRLLDQFARHDAVVQNVLLVIDVVDESVQCIDALCQPARDDVPLALDDESRNDVERPLAIDRAAAFTGVDGERDAHRPNGDLGSSLARGEFADPTTRPTCGTDFRRLGGRDRDR